LFETFMEDFGALLAVDREEPPVYLAPCRFARRGRPLPDRIATFTDTPDESPCPVA
jgi:hypothetical protein